MRLNVEIKKAMYEEFVSHVERDGRSISDVVRQLLQAWNLKKRKELMIFLKEKKADE